MSDNLWLTFKSRIQSSYSNLTNAEKKLADYMIRNPEKIMDAAVTEIAEASGTSPATVIRFSKSCGFSGVADLKMSIRKEYHVYHYAPPAGDISRQDSLTLVKQKMIGYHMKVVQSVLTKWNESAYLNAVEEILNADNIQIVGYGGSKAAAVSMADLFLQLNLPCDLWEDASFATMRIGNMNAGDLVIGINFTGRYRNTVQQLKLAKTRNITTIGITGVLDSPIVEYSDIVLTTNMPGEEYEGSSLSARIAEMAVVEIIYSLIALREGDCAERFNHPNEFLEFGRIPFENNSSSDI